VGLFPPWYDAASIVNYLSRRRKGKGENLSLGCSA